MPSPTGISYMWNYGSLLGLTFASQSFTGIILASNYNPSLYYHTLRAMDYGWFFQSVHGNGASLFFLLMYIHMGRGIYYSVKYHVWLSGSFIFVLSMATAFMGYVLPWGQMSLWGATVITNLVSAVPYVGNIVVEWLWGGYSVTPITLTRFFSLHFLLPFGILFGILSHIFILHNEGSSNPLGINSQLDSVHFHPSFTMKDLLGAGIMLWLFIMLVISYPYILSDPDNFSPANPLQTPPHIQPEWYFLFAYAILRSIPSKLGGVFALVASIMILFVPTQKMVFNPMLKLVYWTWSANFLLLTFLGAQSIEYPFTILSIFSSVLYFLLFFMLVKVD